ncbi:MAG: PQQ-like beta-propeller repeat protein, partial [Phycisphaerae bacterium]|nr:PQQ-like beta-propeller repeat protein [Phycisphaerae bacterium]
ALDAASGKTKWRFAYRTNYVDDFGFDNGPRAVPTISGGRVYTHGASGMLHCLDLATGKQLWSVDTVARFASGKGFFGRASAPLVEGKLLILQAGGRDGKGIVAFDKASGRPAWSATDHEAGYASPVAATIYRQRQLICLTRTGLVILDPADGAIRHQRRFRATMHASINAATPVLAGDVLFLSASYGVGALALRVGLDRAEEIWSGDGILSSHYATPVHHRGLLYGFDGRQERGPRLRCVELATGKVQWTHDALPAGSLIVADEKLLILTEKGQLILAHARPDAFRPTARAQVLGFDTRAFPALSRGRLYARDKKQLICLDLGGPAGPGNP